ncbi:MAG: hypothetical protein HY280_07305 [Nitrospinae bacterium]|nr:hypothetical protein [Nitrospinota bacterium]
MANKSTDLERRMLQDEFWRQEAESLAMAKAAVDLIHSGLCPQKRNALRLSVAMFMLQDAQNGGTRQIANS